MTKDKICEFCDLYNSVHFHEILGDISNNRYEYHYFIRLARRAYDNKYKQYVGDTNFEYMDYRYCPQCGRKIKEFNNED